jgi:hypothetical protein
VSVVNCRENLHETFKTSSGLPMGLQNSWTSPLCLQLLLLDDWEFRKDRLGDGVENGKENFVLILWKFSVISFRFQMR